MRACCASATRHIAAMAASPTSQRAGNGVESPLPMGKSSALGGTRLYVLVARSGRYRGARHADVAELADARRSGRRGGNPVEVRVLSSALAAAPPSATVRD